MKSISLPFITTALANAHRLGKAAPPLHLVAAPIRKRPEPTADWICETRTYQDQNGRRIEAYTPHKGAYPTNLCRFYGMVYEKGNLVCRLPLFVGNVEEAFKTFPLALEKLKQAAKEQQDKIDADFAATVAAEKE